MENVPQAIDFDSAFRGLSGDRQPFRWQRRLHDRLCDGQVPSRCTLPTGLGKTSVISVWLIALARGARLPRRCIYIVNRRTVVDQATDEAERMLALLRSPATAGPHEQTVCRLRDALARIAGDTTTIPLAVSTLRGELADNGEWKKNPARPAIIIGTVDMIGSKLLFSGYGDGRYGRAHHAGLIGQDALIVLDEAHLSPAFSALLMSVEQEQKRDQEQDKGIVAITRPIRVMELSATTRDEAATECVFGLKDEDEADKIVTQRRTAKKTLTFQPYEAGKVEMAKAVAAKALFYRDKAARVLVYVRSPDDAKTVVASLKDKKTGCLGQGADDRVCLLTGTIRGYERDRMAKENAVFRDFLTKREHTPPSQTIYLVSTSAGEVGVDLDADHLVCDLTTLDSMAQRIGRVNRLGGTKRSAEITVASETPTEGEQKKQPKKMKAITPLDLAITKTGEILRGVENADGDVSPSALTMVLESNAAKGAFSPIPAILPATDILFDSWALTSITGELPGRPEVGPYLHGVAEYEPPETYVAWRAEIGELARAGVRNDDLAEMLDAFPIRAAEQLRDTTRRVLDQLAVIAGRHTEAQAILIKNGELQWIGLSQLAPVDKKDAAKVNEARRLLSYATVLLPTEVGGLSKDGMLDGNEPAPEPHRKLDVAEAASLGLPTRQRVRVNCEEKAALLGGPGATVDPKLVERCSLDVSDLDIDDEDAERPMIEYRVAKGERGEPGRNVLLSKHANDVQEAARRIGKSLDLPSEIVDALAIAGRRHDQGKDCECWQRYAKNNGYFDAPNRAGALAKAARYQHWKALRGYRHEFGSLLDTAAADEIKRHPERDLILHLIGSHHGWARPHFRHEPGPQGTSAYDFEGTLDPATGKRRSRSLKENQEAAADAMRRHTVLQRRFGRWGLAWLESLLRCADAMASDASEDGGTA